MKTTIGKKRFLVQLQKPTDPPDGNTYNEPRETHSTVATVWGSLETLAGRELLHAQQVRSEVTHRVCVRYQPGVDSTWRVVVNGKIFQVESALDADNLQRELQILCRES